MVGRAEIQRVEKGYGREEETQVWRDGVMLGRGGDLVSRGDTSRDESSYGREGRSCGG